MMKALYTALTFLLVSFVLHAQETISLDYYFPGSSYDDNIPTPESVFGYQVGEWHLSHDQILRYAEKLDASSDKVIMQEYARSYEDRPLFVLIITNEANHKNLDKLRQRHLSLAGENPPSSLSEIPGVIYQGYSVHGNEPSGANAAVLMMYHLAASQDKWVNDLLDQTIILIDPAFNPDGVQRFSTWVNEHKSKNLISDRQSREFEESWPKGRTNHYWFDLNRDYILLQHPESRGKIKLFHQWKPDIFTDHHEMGTDATFFFQPGVPQRKYPRITDLNQKLTRKIGDYHVVELDQIGSLFYSEESYDDFYIGKGSTYPDLNGGIGILFEQASARGHLQESANGDLSFPFAIRNQVRTSISTLKAGFDLKDELLQMKKDFYNNKKKERGGYLLDFGDSPGSELIFTDLLDLHQIKYFDIAEHESKEHYFKKETSIYIPFSQAQSELIKSLFELRTSFQDSAFYDVSAWSFPLAFNLLFEKIDIDVPKKDYTPEVQLPALARSDYAYILDWSHYFAPAVVLDLQNNGLRLKAANESAEYISSTGGSKCHPGDIVIPVQNQLLTSQEIHQLLDGYRDEYNIQIDPILSGDSKSGNDLGSRTFSTLSKPNVLLLVGKGITSYDAGEVWHLMDQRYGTSLSMMELRKVGKADLSEYTTLILVNGNYSSVRTAGKKKITDFLNSGGDLIAFRSAATWVINNGWIGATIKKQASNKDGKRQPYELIDERKGAQVIGGMIVKANIDLTHPLNYGFRRTVLPLFRKGNLFMEVPDNPYAAPIIYDQNPVWSGFLSKENEKLMSGSAAVLTGRYGKGKIILMADNPNFRAIWYGTNRLTANAILFADMLKSESLLNKKGAKNNQ